MKTTLGIDLGTQSIKVLVYDHIGRTIKHVSSAELTLTQDDSGKAEQNASDWIDAFVKAMTDVPAALKHSIEAISVSGQQHGFVALDVSGEVIAPVKLWCDTTTQPQCEHIMAELGGMEKCIELTGNVMLPAYTAPKILALKQHSPELYAKLDCVLLPHDYLNFWLSGELCMEMGDASGTGLLDVKNRSWSNELINAIDPSGGLNNCLPKLIPNNQSVGVVTEKTANILGLKEGIPVATGGGDNMMAAIGTGTVSAGRIALSFGTSGTLFAFSEKPIIDDEGQISAFCSSNNAWLPLFCSMSCTVTTELYRKLLNIELTEFEESLNSSPIGAKGIITLPYFSGERSPNLPNGKGVMLGLDSQNLTSENVLRSGVEGATFALYQGLQSFVSLGISPTELVMTGGGSNSPLWCQIVADVFNLPVKVLQHNEGAAFGASLQALSLIANDGIVSAEFVDPHLDLESAKTYHARPEPHKEYADVFQRYKQAQKHIVQLYK
jgi:xylulokinase